MELSLIVASRRGNRLRLPTPVCAWSGPKLAEISKNQAWAKKMLVGTREGQLAAQLMLPLLSDQSLALDTLILQAVADFLPASRQRARSECEAGEGRAAGSEREEGQSRGTALSSSSGNSLGRCCFSDKFHFYRDGGKSAEATSQKAPCLQLWLSSLTLLGLIFPPLTASF